ncbi:MAG: type II secretion system protein [Myxococcota bacterium]|nr:type II secretion system protein [Myxococcota bacterium]
MMNVRTTQSKQAQAGFTLVELSIVLGVMTVLAVNFTPSFISAQREGLAEQTVETYYRLADAAVAYYHNEDALWPGMESTETCTIDAQAGIQALSSANYLPQSEGGTYSLTNPWGGEFSLAGHCYGVDELGDCQSCALQIKSVGIPDAVNNMLMNLLPIANGNGDYVTMIVHPDALGSGGGGGDMPSGGIMMSEGECPDGWSHYDMAGRMPVGMGDMDYVQGEASWTRTFNLGEVGADTIQLSGKTNDMMTDKLMYTSNSLESYNNNAPADTGGIFSWMGLYVNENATDSLLGCIEDRNCIEGLIAENNPEVEQKTGGKQVYSPYRVLNFCQKD